MTAQLESYVTIKQAMQKLSCARNSVLYHIRKGKLTTVRFPEAHNLVLIPHSDLEALIKWRKKMGFPKNNGYT